jgi:hypothetical protein
LLHTVTLFLLLLATQMRGVTTIGNRNS